MIELYNNNAISLLKDFESNSIDLIAVDPPYKITSRGNAGNSGGMMQKELSMKGKIFNHNDVNIKDYITEFYRILKDGTHCYIMTNHINLQDMINSATDCGFKFVKCLIWNKGNKIMGGYYMSQFEYILFLRKGKSKRINNCGTADILSISNKKTKINGKNIHDTEKPVELMEILIANSSNENDLILDPFMGSGSTGVACKNLNRKFIGIELDENYFKIAKERIEETNEKLV